MSANAVLAPGTTTTYPELPVLARPSSILHLCLHRNRRVNQHFANIFVFFPQWAGRLPWHIVAFCNETPLNARCPDRGGRASAPCNMESK
jgi:hypothetical protein